MSEPIHRALGLTDDEAGSIATLLGREPNHLELAMYAVMWSEHCSYKSSRIHLRGLPSEAPHVLVGPGENAGVVDVGDGIAAAIRIESHNHPSAIEPYQGAATGAGGIIRDIFTMGARPIALMDPLRFGPLDEERCRWICEGVVSGISGYGNSVGVPTVGGELVFDPTYAENPLVNVLCLGILPTERLVLGRAEGVGNVAVLLGSTTGRDGIGGVSVLASAGFDEGDEAKRPSVQVGDPYEEKRLIEACLELLDANLVVGIQDLGGAGLTCAASETASRGGVGMDFFVSEVPRREAGMEPFEVMTSESQERMLAIVEERDLDAVLAVAERWEVRASVVGRVTDGGALRILDRPNGEVLAEVPAATLHEDAPLYDRPAQAPADLASRQAATVESAGFDSGANPEAMVDDLLSLLRSDRWVYQQYDHQLLLNTVVGPGGDAAVLRLKHPTTGVDTGRGMALTTDGNHRWTALDPRSGTAAVVAESVTNLALVGARPIALVNCLNFGNPEHPEVMWQLSEAIGGMGDACRDLAIPVVGGNVSLYNESRGRNIDPTPVIGLLGLIDQLDAVPPGWALADGDQLFLLGDPNPSASGSRWAWTRRDFNEGLPPQIDIPAFASFAACLREIIAGEDTPVTAAHDIADGGLAVALAELVAMSGVGLDVEVPSALRSAIGGVFAETPGAAILAVGSDGVAALEAAAGQRGVSLTALGSAGGDQVVIGALHTTVEAVADAYHRNLADHLAPAAH